MQINSINNSPQFTSKKVPIRPETIIDSLGSFTFSEIQTKKDLTEVAKGIRRAQANSFKIMNFHGEGSQEARRIYKEINKTSWLNDIKIGLKKLLSKEDGNSTILTVKDEKGKVIGYATMESFEKAKGKVGIIENIHIDYKYTKGELGKHLLEKISQTANGQFSHIITRSPYIGDAFTYNNLGFRNIPENTEAAKFLDQQTGHGIYGWMIKKIDYNI